jgi:hypothetical protein
MRVEIAAPAQRFGVEVPMAASAADRYSFDACGFRVVRGALTHDEVATYNSYLDAIAPESEADRERREFAMRWVFKINRGFTTLIDHPAVIALLEEWVDPKLRLDHAYALVHLAGEDVELHGGPSSPGPAAWYQVRSGHISSGLTVVSWALTDCPSGTGGFRCVPGSHKAEFRVDEVAPDALHEISVEVEMHAGDAILFTEALVHGSGPWQGPASRRTLVYKYAPGTTTWLSQVWTDEDRADLSERQRLMTLPPYEFDVSTGKNRTTVTPDQS